MSLVARGQQGEATLWELITLHMLTTYWPAGGMVRPVPLAGQTMEMNVDYNEVLFAAARALWKKPYTRPVIIERKGKNKVGSTDSLYKTKRTTA